MESKHYRLARSLRSGHSDRDAKPNAQIRDILNQIVAYPPTKQLSNEEQDHVWRFRFYLSNQKKALTKFLKCVNWNHSGEAKQALSMLKIWAPMDVEDALELLSPNFKNAAVRKYAISRLQQAPDEDLTLYLLQLVQALKYENFDVIKDGKNGGSLIFQGCNFDFAAYNRVSPSQGQDVIFSDDDKEMVDAGKDEIESNSESILHRSSSYNQADQIAASNVNSVIEVDPERSQIFVENQLQNLNIVTDSVNTDTLQSELREEDIHLASFLIQRACKNSALANYFYWYLLIECEDQEPTIKQDVSINFN